MKVVLLAAGYATRLLPLTRDRPKPLLEVGGRPILSHALERILELRDVTSVTVVSNARFAAQLGAWAREQRCRVPLQVLDDGTHDEADRLGALGDLALALERSPPGSEDLLVAAGDNLLAFDLAPLRRRFSERAAPLLVVRPVEPRGPSPYNEVVLAEGGRVARFREKPERPSSPWAAIALYFFPGSVARDLRRYLASGGQSDAPGYFLEWLVEVREVFAAELTGAWFDIGTPETLARAREAFARGVQPRSFS